jgi:hypothetical protein
MTANSDLGNVISRLQGLKNVGKRRIMPGEEFLEGMEPEQDIEGIGPKPVNFANLLPKNEPQADFGGEITPQSYDIRANSAQNPQKEMDQPGFWSKLGSSLANAFTKDAFTPKVPKSFEEFKAQNEPQQPQTAPPTFEQFKAQHEAPQTPSLTEIPSEAWQALKDYVSPTKNAAANTENRNKYQDVQLMTQGKNPEEERNAYYAKFQEKIAEAQKNPGDFSVYGSSNEVANSPILKRELEEYTGIDYNPQIQAEVEKYEKIMDSVEDRLNGLDVQLGGQEEGIAQRILNNQSTDTDKYYIGLALLMPLIVGGIFGKEAGLGALGGSAKGVAEMLGGREKNIREDEAALLDINKQRAINQEKLANISLEKSKLPMQIRKNMPEQPNEHLIGMEVIKDDNGKVIGAEIRPGFVAKAKYLNSKKALDKMVNSAEQLSEVKTYVDDVNEITNEVIDIVGKLKDPIIFHKAIVNAMSGLAPGALSQLTPDIEYEGRMQNAGILLEQKLAFLANKYGMAQDLGQLDRAAQSHIKKIMDNPASTLLNANDALDQMLKIRKLVQSGLIHQTENSGFYPEYIGKGLEQKNNMLSGKLNQREDEKYNEQLKTKLMQNEINYAK